MEPAVYTAIDTYLHTCMKDSAHDIEHVYRVLQTSLRISEAYDVNRDVIIAASLLHDIGRDAEYKDKSVCHAIEGGRLAKSFLLDLTHNKCFAEHVEACIVSHRFRTNKKPDTMEAKIIFDSDKLDATGLIGVARTLLYAGNANYPLYFWDAKTNQFDLTKESFVKEYNGKLSSLYDRFYTKEAKEMSIERKKHSEDFYYALKSETDFYRVTITE